MLYKLAISLFLIVTALLFLNYYTNPPDGYTGAPVPDELSCKLCHFYDAKHIVGSTEISGIPQKIVPGKIYPIEVIINNPDKKAIRTSFQFTALNQYSTSGSLLNPKGNVKFTLYKNRNYAESQPGVKIINNKTIFSFDWQAPDEPNNSIISFYATSVLADGDNTFANDAVKETATFGILGNSLDVEVTDFKNNHCRGDSSGYAKIKISGGTPPYSVKWSNGQDHTDINNLKAGLYFATVTDANGFKGIGKIKITEPEILLIDSTIVSHASYNEPGKIEIFLTGGTLPYSFYWKYNASFFSNEQNIYNLNPGDYHLKITDSCNTELDTLFHIENKTATFDNTLSEKVFLYPNPATSFINISSQNHKIKQYSLYNLSFNIVKQENNINNSNIGIDISSLKTGLYILRLSIDNQNIIQKIIIQ